MPEWGWIIVFAVGAPAVLYLLWHMGRYGGRVSHSGTTIIVNGKRVTDSSPTSQALKYVTANTGEMEELLFGRYLKMILDRGADRESLIEYDDSMFVKQLFHSIITGGNGSESWQQIIQTHIVDGQYMGHMPHDYAETEVWPQMLSSAKKYLNAEYYSTVLQRDGTRRERWVTNTDLVDEVSDGEVAKRAIRMVARYIEYAKGVHK